MRAAGLPSEPDPDVGCRPSAAHTGNHATIWRWREACQNDFAARMAWTIQPPDKANHPPVAVLAHAETLTVSSARDGQPVPIQGFDQPKASFVVPAERVMPPGTGTMHVILAVTDHGTPRLTRYRRVIVTVASEPAARGRPGPRERRRRAAPVRGRRVRMARSRRADD